MCCWKLASRAQSGNCAATTAISTGGSPRPPTFELSKEIGFQLSRSGALWLLSQEQTLGLEVGGVSQVYVLANVITHRQQGFQGSPLISFELYLLIQGSLTSRSKAISF